MTDAREIVARAIQKQEGHNGDDFIELLRMDADAILAALAERGITEDMLNRIIRGEAVVVPVAHCCECGRLVDTRERDDGGDRFGCEMNDGRWTCSEECYDRAMIRAAQEGVRQ